MHDLIIWWQHIYSHINPVAFTIFGFKVHWYALMYITALVVGFYAAVYFGKKFGIEQKIIEEYFVWAEIGIIIGARVGYFIFYVPHNEYFLLHPWEMFNPFHNGKLVGISGMSYHGAVIGFIVSTLLFWKIKKIDLWKLVDVVALATPLGYIFGRIGNFLNGLIVGRPTDVAWGVYIDGTLRHPIGIYEAFFEGFLTFVVIYIYYKKFYKCKGELISLYLITYGVFRSLCEMWRRPDPQLGFIFDHVTMGQILSFFMIIGGIILFIIRRKSCKKSQLSVEV
jgi:phosphatidylglycerol:prolipoprotein diacylglycerol transferase